MRGLRWLLLASIAAILGAVGFTYHRERRAVELATPPKPEQLPQEVTGQAQDWHLTNTVAGRAVVEIFARNFKQEKDSTKVELGGVRLKLFHKDGKQFDYVESAHALFDPVDKQLYSDGEVTITLGVPAAGEPKRQLVSIRTSGVSFVSDTGKASTERPAEFTFENGTGKSTGGAIYDPHLRELWMRGGVELNWRGSTPNAKPMKIETAELIYKEAGSHIMMYPWTKLTRATSLMEGGDAIVLLKDGAIEVVEASNARGMDKYPQRELRYGAEKLFVHFNAEGEVAKVTAHNNARLTSLAAASTTEISGDRVDLDFEVVGGESVLKYVKTIGKGTIESKPVIVRGAAPPPTRILRSDVIEMAMRPGGEEIESVVTPSQGKLEFVPNTPGQRRRELDGETLTMEYGPRNILRTFRAMNVVTKTAPAVPGGPVLETSSRKMEADFDPESGQMAKMRQWENFRYAEGPRKATAGRAEMDASASRITLETSARVWDDTGSTSADTIRLNQQNGDFDAEGNVNSSRKDDKKKQSPGMLAGDGPMQAIAAKMTSSDRNSQIHYEGNAVLWQGPNRVKADRIDINREVGRLTAAGHVESQLLDKGDGKKSAPALTVVRSAALVYTESDRQAYYSGGARMIRPGMNVKSLELRAILAESGSESSLEKALADGSVEIVQTGAGRTRTGTSEHAEYFVPEDKIVLKGGNPLLVDSVKGNTRGGELTYFAADDRLLVNGVPDRPATSRLRRK